MAKINMVLRHSQWVLALSGVQFSCHKSSVLSPKQTVFFYHRGTRVLDELRRQSICMPPRLIYYQFKWLLGIRLSFCGLKCTTFLSFKVHHPEEVFLSILLARFVERDL
jgi:hypothetical protein